MIPLYDALVIYSSATTATRVKNMLYTKNIPCKVIQTPKHLSQGGCGYSVIAPQSALETIRSFSNSMSVHIKGVYFISDQGRYIPIA